MFTRLQTKLVVLFAGLFGLAILLCGAVVYTEVSENAGRTVRRELLASGEVFDRLWELRSSQIQDGASLLARDFGFREAVATRDDATIRSALDNLRARLDLHRAFIMDIDGAITGLDTPMDEARAAALWMALDSDPNAAGVTLIDNEPYQAIAAPILSPTLAGWVVFAVRLDAAEMAMLEKLSAIPLQASVLRREAQGAWTPVNGEDAFADARRLNRFVDAMLKPGEARELDTRDGRVIALAKPLHELGGDGQSVLLLRYPLALALAPYRPILLAVVLVGLLGVSLVVAGSWALARQLTRPIIALDAAAQQLARGAEVSVPVETRDEIGRLAGSFNTMAAEIRARERTITHLALHDAETDLPNRVALAQFIAAASGDGATVVAAMGVDRFHQVRGAIGYALANALLRKIALRLGADRPGLYIARVATSILGVVYRAADGEEAMRFAAALQECLNAPIRLGDDSIDASLTIGLAFHEPGDSPETTVDRAGIALDQARAARRKIARFDADAYGDPARNLSLTSDLMAALGNGGTSIFLQPKYDLRRRSVTGAEALVRWRDPRRGMVPPDLFIGMAEQTGHIRPLTDWVLGEAVAAQATLRAAGHDLTIAVNVSGRLMDDEDFARDAIGVIGRAGADICFEITETAVIDNPDVALRLIDRYAAAGISISIDDYGSGLSSLAYLKQIHANELKIDKTFVMSLAQGHRDALLVKSTIDLAHSLGLKVTAEGVETAEALAVLQTMGCDLAQGYFTGRPMPVADLLSFLRTPDRSSALSQA
ncbi:MAG: EAL domain-containing protein [Hyphomonadaceae bacterium]|nr:EAL domain-containing protein [Hyphomonadaceae bacterium]